MSEKTLVAQRLVSDAIQEKLGNNNLHKVYDVPITKKMITSCKSSRSRYSQFLEDQAKEINKTEAGKRKKRVIDEISESKAKKQKLESSSKRLLEEADRMLEKAEKERSFTYLTVFCKFSETEG